MQDASTPVIQFKGIKKKLGDRVILDNLDLDVIDNEILGLVGKSGAGKTTLLRILMGYYPPDSGKILYQGKDVTHSHQLRSIIGLTTQDNSFYEKLTVRENLLYFGKMYGVSTEDINWRITKLLDLMELQNTEKILAKNLSGGMKRRLDFAISLIHDPHILILDEPTTGLDPILRNEIWETIWNIRDYGKTIIVSTHFFDELEKHCHRIGILHKKKIIVSESPDWYAKRYYPKFAQTFAYLLNPTTKEEKK